MTLHIAVAACVGLLAACGKVQEAASEKMVEKAIESAISKDGTQAKVDLSKGSMTVESTDAQGRTNKVEIGGARVTEADAGVPFYPGAKVPEGGSTRSQGPDGTMTMVALQSGDAPDKVAAFYRDQLKSRAQGKQFMDSSSGDGGHSLMLGDDKAGSMVHVTIGKEESGSSIQIVTTQRAAK
jgi:hypothetical protein